jgi:hypothetical protein
MSGFADKLRRLADELDTIPRHHQGSELYEQMYRIMSANRHRISYQLDDLAANADTVREWLDSVTTGDGPLDMEE